MRTLLRRVWYLIHHDRNQCDLADELGFHREMKERELRDRGLASADVRSSAQRAMGNDLSARQRSRDVWIWPWLQDISQDIRFGIRMLLKDRRFTFAAVIALALGIAVNNSVFTIANAALLRDLPFVEPDRLVAIRIFDRSGLDGVAYEDLERLVLAKRSFEGMAASGGGSMNISEPSLAAERLRGTYISTNAFRLLRSNPILGRTFVDQDDHPGAASVAVIGYAIWQSRYGGAADVIGRSVRINEVPTTIIGVMPQGFGFPLTASLWVPLSQAPGLTTTARRARTLQVVARLAPGSNLAQGADELNTMWKAANSDHAVRPEEHRVVVTPLKESFVGGAWTFVAILMTAVAFVLLIACANVTSLMLARSAHRAREIAVRASLGATRWRIARQILIECAVIGIAAGVVGFVLSRYGSEAMSVAFNSTEIGAPGQPVKPYWVDLSMNSIAWAFLATLCLAGSLGIGILPSWHLSKINANDVLKDGGRGVDSVRARRWTSGLLIGQLALTTVLLTGAGLNVRSFFALYFKDLVISTANVVTMRVELPARKYASAEQRLQFNRDLDQRVSSSALFASATLASDIPLQPLGFGGRMLAIEGQTLPVTDKPSPTSFVNVGPRYFETLGLAVLRGRGLTDADGQRGHEGVIVNQRFATKYFSSAEESLGQRIQLSGPTMGPDKAPWLTIVGVVPTLPNFFPDRMDDPVVYVPLEAEQAPQRVISIIVRTAGSPSSAAKVGAASALREQVASVDPDLPLFAIQTLDEAVARGRYVSQVTGSWFLTLAVISLILASVGLYALTAHGVAQRIQEIGVRIALGAERRQVMWLFLQRTAIQLAFGLTFGLAGALALGQVLRSMLREIDARDPLTLALVSVILVTVTFVASALPARRAAKMDPSVALRAD